MIFLNIKEMEDQICPEIGLFLSRLEAAFWGGLSCSGPVKKN
jgi:hypothetical protein